LILWFASGRPAGAEAEAMALIAGLRRRFGAAGFPRFPV